MLNNINECLIVSPWFLTSYTGMQCNTVFTALHSLHRLFETLFIRHKIMTSGWHLSCQLDINLISSIAGEGIITAHSSRASKGPLKPAPNWVWKVAGHWHDDKFTILISLLDLASARAQERPRWALLRMHASWQVLPLYSGCHPDCGYTINLDCWWGPASTRSPVLSDPTRA